MQGKPIWENGPLFVASLLLSMLVFSSVLSSSVTAQNVEPNCDAGKDFSVAVAETANFDGTATDADGFIVKYEWDFEGDGTFDYISATKGEATWTYQVKGTYHAMFRVTDNDGAQDNDTVRVSVVSGNKPPTANAGPDLKVHAMEVVTLQGSGTDLDGHIVKYEWDFNGDGKYEKSSSTNGTMTWIYTTEGTYHAVLKVTDDGAIPANATDTCDVKVYPANQPPVANAGGDQTVHAKQVFRVIGKGTDVDGKITKYQWDFDSNGVVDRESTATGEALWSFDTPGTYKATFTVTDNAALPSTGSDKITITVLAPNKPPVAAAGAAVTAGVDTVVQFQGTGTDEDGTIVEYKWDFNGDGTYDWSSSSGGATYSVYPKAGTYQAKFIVVDDTGATGNATRTVTIQPKKEEPAPPLIQFNATFILALLIGIGIGAGAGIGAAYGAIHVSIARKYKRVKELEATHHGDDEAAFRGTQVGEREPPSFRGGDGF